MPEPAHPTEPGYFLMYCPALRTDFRKELLFGSVSALPDHHAAGIIDDDFALLLDAPRPNLNDAPLRLRFGLPRFQNLGFRVQRVAGKQGVRQLDFIPTQSEPILAHIRNAHSRNNGEGESTVDQTSSELRGLAIFLIEWDLIAFVGQEGEPNVVIFRHSSSEAASVNVSDLEILKIASFPTRLNRHADPP